MDDQQAARRLHDKIPGRILKAAVKSIIVYAIYFGLTSFLAPAYQIVPELQQTIETFVILYISLMIVAELTAGTIIQHLFNVGRALFVILYMIFALGGGTFSTTYEGIGLTIDLSLFLMAAILLGLLGLAKSILQAVDFMHQKTETISFGSSGDSLKSH